VRVFRRVSIGGILKSGEFLSECDVGIDLGFTVFILSIHALNLYTFSTLVCNNSATYK